MSLTETLSSQNRGDVLRVERVGRENVGLHGGRFLRGTPLLAFSPLQKIILDDFASRFTISGVSEILKDRNKNVFSVSLFQRCMCSLALVPFFCVCLIESSLPVSSRCRAMRLGPPGDSKALEAGACTMRKWNS